MATRKPVSTSTSKPNNTKQIPPPSAMVASLTPTTKNKPTQKAVAKPIKVVQKSKTVRTSDDDSSNNSDSDEINNSTEPSIEEQFTSQSLHQSIMVNPGMYIGSTIMDKYMMWILNEDYDAMVYQEIKYVPGLYKIFDEILVNTRDQTIRDPTCKTIKIYLDRETGTISCYNDGDNGIPVQMHKVEKVYVPEMIFGKLLTSGNYNKKKKITGGKHGYGAKLTNIFSDKFVVEIGDSKQKLKFIQTFTNHMYQRDAPKITKYTAKSYTQITFHPDYSHFGIEGMNEDTYALFQKRVYDIAAIIGTQVKVYLNDKHINIPSFEKYSDMFYRNIDDDNGSDDINDNDDNEDNEQTDDNDEDNDSMPKMRKAKPKANRLNTNKIYTETNDGRWKVCVVYDNQSGFRQISYVNSICTSKGGSHVGHVVDMIVSDISKRISEKHKDVTIRNSYIKENLTFFIDCVIEDPDFDSQTKETLTSRVSDFGSRFNYNEEFIKKILKTGIEKEVVEFSRLKEMKEFKPMDVGKKNSLKDLKKLVDAEEAGGRRSSETRLILTEGDSAKTFAVSGLREIGSKFFGIFPLKGKMLNVRGTTIKKVNMNEEIKNIMRILGLDPRVEYTDTKKLRYGGVIILTDQDTDGFHIKGLFINFLHFFWPSLIAKVDSYVQTMSTPILKAHLKTDYKIKNAISFMTEKEYLDWSKTVKNLNDYKIKYYKGLGTHTAVEARECFVNFAEKIITISWDNASSNTGTSIIPCDLDIRKSDDSKTTVAELPSIDDQIEDMSNPTNQSLDQSFNPKKADLRKTWLSSYNADEIIENDVKNITVCQFVNLGLKHFSADDNVRSIASVCDGLKPSQRKVLDATFKKKLYKKTVKLALLAGAVIELEGYHHGEVSIHTTAIGMAQRFIASNNISLLYPAGQFGTRLQGGKDYASPRYIETRLDDLTSLIIRPEDDIILERIIDDGMKIEPKTFAPIVPLVLINGAQGIGTGYSDFVPCYNIVDVVNNLKLLANNKKPREMMPWYRGFKGAIEKISATTYKTYGNYEEINENTIRITELPIGVWTENYIIHLNTLTIEGVALALKAAKPKGKAPGAKSAVKKPTKINEPIIKTYVNSPSETTIDIVISFVEGELQNLIKTNTLESKLKLSKTVSISNMYLWNVKGDKIKKYKTPEDILKDFYKYRLECYELRKVRYTQILENDLNISMYKVKFLEDVIAKKIVLDNKQKKHVIEKLKQLKYPELSKQISFESEAEKLLLAEDNDEAEADDETKEKTKDKDVYTKSYKYITGLQLFSLTKEKLDQLKNEHEMRKAKYEEYVNTPVKTFMLNELDELLNAYFKWLRELEEEENPDKKAPAKRNVASKRVVNKKP